MGFSFPTDLNPEVIIPELLKKVIEVKHSLLEFLTLMN
jgi:hypothetical protein